MSRASLTFTSGDIAPDLAPHERTEPDVADRPICSPGEDVRNGSGRLERDRTRMDASTMRAVRGNDISMIFQEPMTSLNPVLTIGAQISETARLHQDLTKAAAWEKAVEMLRRVRIPEPAQRANEYPHQLSGGMRQRAMIAMALA